MPLIEKYLNKGEYYSFHEHKGINSNYFCNARAFEEIVRYSLKKINDVELVRTSASHGVECNITSNKVFIRIHLRIAKNVSLHEKTIEIQRRVSNKIYDILEIKVNSIDIKIHEFKK
ncbi:hypothetical protein ASO20_00020 [Mycoplasma sp. (ex Biomphalaria glabrata)]|uniref:hypothetical protein n=1 Tax=Mycoplasma sp. (ex Biomphalaria glabrata) TaxID=1749074 RepID=UPI00073A999F|nr:hypothetical protein [Mycoplasma sp. (ex Biomphalaria glabrata)]ALV23067.1 hypothetical protein ASO20_00020 [Mycoplasma sp. (ex Biomphalaria glabrata)]